MGAVYRPKKFNFTPPLVGGQRSNKYAFWRAIVAIKKENGLVPPCSILLRILLASCLLHLSIMNFLVKSYDPSENQ